MRARLLTLEKIKAAKFILDNAPVPKTLSMEGRRLALTDENGKTVIFDSRSPARLEDESFRQYRQRRKILNQSLGHYLKGRSTDG